MGPIEHNEGASSSPSIERQKEMASSLEDWPPLWPEDESRAELEVECGSWGVSIRVFSCSDTVNIRLSEYGTLEIE